MIQAPGFVRVDIVNGLSNRRDDSVTPILLLKAAPRVPAWKGWITEEKDRLGMHP